MIDDGLVTVAWLDQLKASDLAADSRRAYRGAVRAFFAWCDTEQLPPGDVARADIARWRDELLTRYSQATVTSRMSAIRSYYDYLLDRHLVDRNPAHRLGVAAAAAEHVPQRRELLTDREVQQLLDTTASGRDDRRVAVRDRAILYLMFRCQMSTIEIHRAETGDLVEDGDRLILWTRPKGHRVPDRRVTLSKRCEQLLDEWLAVHPKWSGPLFVNLSRLGNGSTLSVGYIRRMVKNRMRRAGIEGPGKTAHSLVVSGRERRRRR